MMTEPDPGPDHPDTAAFETRPADAIEAWTDDAAAIEAWTDADAEYFGAPYPDPDDAQDDDDEGGRSWGYVWTVAAAGVAACIVGGLLLVAILADSAATTGTPTTTTTKAITTTPAPAAPPPVVVTSTTTVTSTASTTTPPTTTTTATTAATPTPDTAGYMTALSDSGIAYRSQSDIIATGMQTCQELRAGAYPPTAVGFAAETHGYGDYRNYGASFLGAILSVAVDYLCPDQRARVDAWSNGGR